MKVNSPTAVMQDKYQAHKNHLSYGSSNWTPR